MSSDPRLSGPARHADDTRRHFLAEIVARVPLDRIAEVHLFTPIRQGGAETGVAVVVARRIVPDEIETPPACDPTDDAAGPPPSPDTEAPNVPDDEPPAESPPSPDAGWQPEAVPRRHTIFSARYRHTLRGPDRGRWETDVVEEADAPLLTVEAVVRGVQRRAGDAASADRLDQGAVARVLGAPGAA